MNIDQIKNTIICGDCLPIMRDMADNSVDLVVTDPPYPGLKGGIKHFGGGVAESVNQSMSVGDLWEANLEWISEAWRVTDKGMIVFCSYHSVDLIPQKIPEAKKAALFTWNKISAPVPVNNVPHFTTEFAWGFRKNPGLTWRKVKTLFNICNLTAGCISTGERITNPDGRSTHPTQKPLRLMAEILKIGGDLIFDPFCGSGTTCVAAKRLGRDYIGIDISPEYCEIARKRLEADEKGITVKELDKGQIGLFNG